jgi:HK97 family phage major capsid protein
MKKKNRAKAMGLLAKVGWKTGQPLNIVDGEGSPIETKSFWSAVDAAKSFTAEEIPGENAIIIQWHENEPDGEMDQNAMDEDDEDEDTNASIKSLKDEVNNLAKALKSATINAAKLGTVNPHAATATNEPIKVKSVARVLYEHKYEKAGRKGMLSPDSAEAFGHYMIGAVLPRYGARVKIPHAIRQKSIEFLGRRASELGIKSDGNATFPADAGGAWTATQFSPDLIFLVNQFGIAQQYARVEPMTEGQAKYPIGQEGLRFYPTEESTAITSSKTLTWNVTLNAKSFKAYTSFSREINMDSIISLGGHYGPEFARAAARTQDDCFFNGDGTSAYASITGITKKFTLGTSVGAINTDLANVSATNWAAYTEGHVHKLMSLLPTYVRQLGTARFFGNSDFYYRVWQPIAFAKGGVTAMEIINGVPTKRMVGPEFVDVEVMNSNPATTGSTIDLLYGDLTQAAILGDRQDLDIDISEEAEFREDNIAMKGVMRFDVKVHTTETTDISGTVKPGPVVALYQV